MNHTIACDISVTRRRARLRAAGRALRGHAPQHPLVRRAGTRAVTPRRDHEPGHRRKRVLRFAARRAPRRRRAPGAGARPQRRRRSPDRRRVRRSATSATDRSWRQAVEGCDVVFNNVAQVPLAKDAELLRTVNVDGTTLLAGARRRASAWARWCTRRRARCSACRRPTRCCRRPCRRPVEAYGRAKLAAEWACLDAVSNGLDVTIIRPRTILGHGRLGIFGILFDWVADGADIFVLGDGRQPVPVHPRRRSRRGVHSRRRRRRARRVQRRHRPIRHDARVAGVLCRHAGTGSRVRSLPAGPTVVGDEGRRRLRIWPRSRRTTG